MHSGIRTDFSDQGTYTVQWNFPSTSTHELYTEYGVTKIELRNWACCSGEPGWKLYFGSTALAVRFWSGFDRMRIKDHGGNVIDNNSYQELETLVRVDDTIRFTTANYRDHQWVNWLMQGLTMYINFDIRQPR